MVLQEHSVVSAVLTATLLTEDWDEMTALDVSKINASHTVVSCWSPESRFQVK